MKPVAPAMNSVTQQEQSRKRPAPGAWPQNPSQSLQSSSGRLSNMQNTSDMSDDQLLSWPGNRTFSTQSDNSPHLPQFTGPTMLGSDARQHNNQALVRRMNNAQLGDQDPYNTQLQHLDNIRGSPQVVDDSDDDDLDLEARAQEAKREAASRRPPRQIPPFIQKLSSFLDDPKSHQLIRWAEDGKSFIVFDEDRFANELIPEMFKHNNYASFVRQLNMYGFHKKVGLSDNSMRASEKKAKLPSGYRHKYFRRGRSDLLWLIEKPKPGNLSSKKRPSRADAKEEGSISPDRDDLPGSGRRTASNTDLVTVPRSDLSHYNNLQQEVQDLQKSQQHIYGILKSMRDENKQYIKQATFMLANHERHESSINAILQFLATFYNQSLQGGNNPANMFSSSIPSHQQSSVVEDMGDFTDSHTDFPQMPRQQTPQHRRPLLLHAPPTNERPSGSPRRNSPFVKTESTPQLEVPSRADRPNSSRSSQQHTPEPDSQQSPRQPDNSDILNVINRQNAQTAQPRYDLSALQQYSQNANGNQGPLTNEQRDAMLSIMASNSGTTTPTIPGSSSDGGNITGTDPNPYLDYFEKNKDQLDYLQKLQDEQDSRVQNLAGRLQPLSPSGSIPGLDMLNRSSQELGDQSLQDSQLYSGQYNSQSDGYGFDFDNYLNNDVLEEGGGYDANSNFDIDWDDFEGEGDTTGDPLFGETPSGQDQSGDAEGDTQAGGRIMGSVGTSSSGAPTPRPPSVQDDGEGHPGKKRKLNG